mmetsp:Transcript_10941/g.20606  ORF Transcript_10941/g.20606 Transcript_10941/m.20606 type:complete len:233 (-) Transcript_10941:414-1112(-)
MREPSSTSSSKGGRSSASSSSSATSSSIDRPSLIMRWMRPPKVLGSSNVNPDVSIAVSNNNSTRSFTVLSDLSASARLRSSPMIELEGLISIVFLDAMYEDMELSRRACAFIMRSMFADHPYSPVTSTHGESTIRSDTSTFSTLSPRMSFMTRHRDSNCALISSFSFFSSSVSSNCNPSLVQDTSFFPSYSFSCCTAYSSIGSTMKSTSKPFFFSFSMNGEFSTALRDSPVM